MPTIWVLPVYAVSSKRCHLSVVCPEIILLTLNWPLATSGDLVGQHHQFYVHTPVKLAFFVLLEIMLLHNFPSFVSQSNVSLLTIPSHIPILRPIYISSLGRLLSVTQVINFPFLGFNRLPPSIRRTKQVNSHRLYSNTFYILFYINRVVSTVLLVLVIKKDQFDYKWINRWNESL